MSDSHDRQHWESHFDLSAFNTMAMPSHAEYFVAVENEEQLVSAVKQAKKQQLALHILGGGSNVLCPSFIKGLVIKTDFQGVSVSDTVAEKGNNIDITVAAGENWHDLVVWSLQQGYYGLENLALIPGSVGAAPIQNIGAYGVEVSDRLVRVRWYDCDNDCFMEYDVNQCQLGYRDSIFKHVLKGKAIITQVVLRLTTTASPIISYAPLNRLFKNQQPTPQRVFDLVCEIRRSKLPDPKYIPNVGSFFKNPIISQVAYDTLIPAFPDLPGYPQDNKTVKVPAAWLIDHAGLKGAWVQMLKVHDQQALVLTNPNEKGFEDVMAACNEISQVVWSTFGISLEAEPQVL